jgi:hypothetical protein
MRDVMSTEAMPRQSRPFQYGVRGILLLQAHLAAVIACCSSVYRTDGEVRCGLSWFVFFVLTLVCIGLWLAGRRRIAVALVLVSLGPLAWRQVVLVHRLARLEAEVVRLSAYIKTCQRDASGYRDISGYRFCDPSLRKYIRLWPQTDLISYKLFEGDTTCREYSPSRGWYYYPD